MQQVQPNVFLYLQTMLSVYYFYIFTTNYVVVSTHFPLLYVDFLLI